MMKVLVTGNLGYVGPAVVNNIKQQYPDCVVYGLDTCFFQHYYTEHNAYNNIPVDHQIHCDLRDITKEHFENIDVVIHLAAISNDPMGEKFSKVTQDINFLASKRTAYLAKEAGVRRFIFASSCSVYGASDIGVYVSEEDSLNPVTTYAKSKIEFETYLHLISSQNFQPICLRFATACGASNHLRLDLVLNDFVFTALQTGKIEILSDGSPWRPLIDTQDMANAINWACTHNLTESSYFLSLNVGDQNNNFQIRDLAQLVKNEIGNITISLNKNASPDTRSYKVGFEKFKALAPNHQPQVTIQKSINQLVCSVEKMLRQEPNINIDKYKRLHILNKMIDDNAIDSALKWKE